MTQQAEKCKQCGVSCGIMVDEAIAAIIQSFKAFTRGEDVFAILHQLLEESYLTHNSFGF